MALENYLKAKRIAPTGIDSLMPFVLPLSLNDKEQVTFGVLNADWQTIAEAESAFLRETNLSLIDKNPTNDVSYLFSFVGTNNNDYESANIIQLTGLSQGHIYNLTINGLGSVANTILQISDINGSVFFAQFPMWTIESGRYVIETKFKANQATAQFAVVRRDNQTSPARLFGVTLSEIKSPK